MNKITSTSSKVKNTDSKVMINGHIALHVLIITLVFPLCVVNYKCCAYNKVVPSGQLKNINTYNNLKRNESISDMYNYIYNLPL